MAAEGFGRLWLAAKTPAKAHPPSQRIELPATTGRARQWLGKGMCPFKFCMLDSGLLGPVPDTGDVLLMRRGGGDQRAYQQAGAVTYHLPRGQVSLPHVASSRVVRVGCLAMLPATRLRTQHDARGYARKIIFILVAQVQQFALLSDSVVRWVVR
eukprot:2359904-Rhodomonas_salina.2